MVLTASFGATKKCWEVFEDTAHRRERTSGVLRACSTQSVQIMCTTDNIHRIAVAIVVLSAGLCSHNGVQASCSIELNNGRFSWMVGIHEDVARSRSRGDRHDYRDLKASIIEKFTKASQWLYRATKQRTYVSEITVVVPNSWRGDPSFQCAKQCETYERAKIKIRQPRVDSRGRELHGAYVVPGRCGEEGMLMHLTASRIAAESVRLAHMLPDIGMGWVGAWKVKTLRSISETFSHMVSIALELCTITVYSEL